MKRLVNRKVKSKNDIRFYCVISGENLSIRDTLTHDYLAFLTLDDTGKALEIVQGLLELSDIDYYTLVLNTGVGTDYLKECAQRYKEGLKDTRHTESIEWVNKAWHDQTIQLIEDNNLGEMEPIGANGALEAVLKYEEPKGKRRPLTHAKEEDSTSEEEPVETSPKGAKTKVLTKAKRDNTSKVAEEVQDTQDTKTVGKKRLIRRIKK